MIGNPAIFHSGNPSSNLRTRYPRRRSRATASNESTRTTKLYDRTSDQITLDEVEKIQI